jgi:hypothetical protein
MEGEGQIVGNFSIGKILANRKRNLDVQCYVGGRIYILQPFHNNYFIPPDLNFDPFQG